MPRRKPKHAFVPGQSGNPAGRPHGSVNEINNSIRTAFAMLLHNQLPNLESWLAEGAKRDPLKTADLLLRISERFTPSLSRTEITGAEGVPFSPITINLPNIPKVSIGESTASSLLTSPAEEVKAIGEGNLAEIPVFLSELPAKEEVGEGAPAEELGGHYGHRQSVVSESPGHLEHLDIAVSGEISEILPDDVGASSQKLPDSEANPEELPLT